MRTHVQVIAATAAVLIVVGCQSLSGSAGSGNQPSVVASPSRTPLASGTFKAKGADVELDATGDGDNVTGTLTVSHESGDFTVNLGCTRTAEDGRVLIAGDTTDSTSSYATKGTYSAIVLKPGSPVTAVFGFKGDAPSAASCMAYLDGIIDQTFATVVGDGALEPIEGAVTLGS